MNEGKEIDPIPIYKLVLAGYVAGFIWEFIKDVAHDDEMSKVPVDGDGTNGDAEGELSR